MTKPKVAKIVDPLLKEKWVTALRSGKYKQGQGALKSIDAVDKTCKHCCLGVLLEIVEPEGFIDPKVGSGQAFHKFSDAKTSQAGYPNETKMKELGLTRKMMHNLAEMNDASWTKKRDFSEIADYIEETL